MRVFSFVLALLVPVAAAAQATPTPPSVAQIQQWYEAGQYQQIISAPASPDPKAAYLVGTSFERLKRAGDARTAYQRLASRPASDPWGQIGRSAVALLDVPVTATGAAAPAPAPDQAGTDPATIAEQAARRAITAATPSSATSGAPSSSPPTNPVLAIAHYQLGLVLLRRGNQASAAESFGRASTADPGFAYAHYFAGLMYSRISQLNQTSSYWSAFLKLAPKAPEAPQVLSIMRTLRGR